MSSVVSSSASQPVADRTPSQDPLTAGRIPEGLPRLEDGGMSIVRRPELLFRRSWHPVQLTLWIGGAVLAGILCGLAGTSLVDTSPQYGAPVQQASPSSTRQQVPASGIAQEATAPSLENAPVNQTVVAVTYPPAGIESSGSIAIARDSKAAQDLEQVKTRNRRLEALVKVLRRRDASERHVRNPSQKN